MTDQLRATIARLGEQQQYAETSDQRCRSPRGGRLLPTVSNVLNNTVTESTPPARHLRPSASGPARCPRTRRTPSDPQRDYVRARG
jgi:hypothetical protein